MALSVYLELHKNGHKCPTLHLEHAPIFTEESLKILMQHKLDCVFHFQPSHWINDRQWYRKEYNHLKPHKIYPFKELQTLGYPFYVGSDAPIEESENDLTLKGLNCIQEDYSLASTKF